MWETGVGCEKVGRKYGESTEGVLKSYVTFCGIIPRKKMARYDMRRNVEGDVEGNVEGNVRQEDGGDSCMMQKNCSIL